MGVLGLLVKKVSWRQGKMHFFESVGPTAFLAKVKFSLKVPWFLAENFGRLKKAPSKNRGSGFLVAGDIFFGPFLKWTPLHPQKAAPFFGGKIWGHFWAIFGGPLWGTFLAASKSIEAQGFGHFGPFFGPLFGQKVPE